MTSKIFSIATFGLSGQLVEIEVDTSNGLPGITIVGLPDKAVEEARERIRSAIKNAGFSLPPKRFTINLIPADIPKKGSIYDLPIALALLCATGQVKARLDDAIFIGELGLDGTLKPTQSALIAAEIVRANKLKRLFLPSQSTTSATLIEEVSCYPVKSLRGLVLHLLGEKSITAATTETIATTDTVPDVRLEDIYGQEAAKRALVIAVAGNHNILLTGTPGSGKTMLAKAAVSLMPHPSKEEVIEMSKIHCLASGTQLTSTRPFRSPHHTASDIAIIGGGQWPKPGEISLAHRGILFLDEVPEFKRSVLEVLRQPLEEGYVSIARANGHYRFPAQFMLIAAQNPCPCGYYGDTKKMCTCTQAQIQRYQTRLSGPLLDRIDLVIPVKRPQTGAIIAHRSDTHDNNYKTVIANVRKTQKQRFGGSNTQYNAQMTNEQIKLYCALDVKTQALAKTAIEQLNLSARSYYRTLKISRTIADLDNSEQIETKHLTEALSYRFDATA